jgi:hypothetical protein
MKTKICVKCGEEKDIELFGKSADRKDGRQVYCKKCRGKYSTSNRENLATYHKKYRTGFSYEKWSKNYREVNKERFKVRNKEYRLKMRMMAFEKYGGAICSCCGEKEIAFLALDHIDGGGTQQRKILKGGSAIYHWVYKNNYPEGFRVLCHNCNWGIHVNNGICPHKRVDRKIEEKEFKI